MSIISDMSRLLDSSGLATFNRQEGCSPEEVAALQKLTGAKLPKSYKEFLRLMGKKCGDFYVGTDYLYPKPLTFRADAEALLRECESPFKLPAGAFVFLFHQGYQFLFFNVTKKSPDPSVFRFGDELREPVKVDKNFASWFKGAIEDFLAGR